jgi:hypothetical protein
MANENFWIWWSEFVGLAYYQGKKDIVFIRFIIEYT